MIYLEQGQKVTDRPDLVVYEPTGERNDTDMVICAETKNPSEPFCWLEAQYIAYGGVVYKISDEKELEAEILKIDPDSTINDIATEPVVTPESSFSNINEPIQEVQIEQTVQPDNVPVSNTIISEPIISSTPEIGTPISETSTSTPSIAPVVESIPPIIDNVSTSTSPIIEPIIETIIESATSTAPVEPVVETSPIIEPVISYLKKRVKRSLS